MTPQQRDRLIAALATLLIAVVAVMAALYTSLTYPPEDTYMPMEAKFATADSITIAPLEDLPLPNEFARLGDGDIYDDFAPDPPGGEEVAEDMNSATADDIDTEPADPASLDTRSTTTSDIRSESQTAKPTAPSTKVDPNKAEEEKRLKAEKEEKERQRKAEEQKKTDAKKNVDGHDMSNKFKGPNGGNNAQAGNGGGRRGQHTGSKDGLSIRGRKLISWENVKGPEVGTVKVRIVVAPDGHVAHAEPAGGSISDPAVREACVKASNKLKYSPVDASQGNQTGIITWNIK